MFRRRPRQNRFLLTISVLFILLPLIVMGADKNHRSNDGNVEGWVSSINREVLYIDGQEYRLSENVRVFIGSESGWEVTLNTITDVGQIHKALIHIDKGLVQRIVILEVQQ
jgi:hypothetical protein